MRYTGVPRIFKIRVEKMHGSAQVSKRNFQRRTWLYPLMLKMPESNIYVSPNAATSAYAICHMITVFTSTLNYYL